MSGRCARGCNIFEKVFHSMIQVFLCSLLLFPHLSFRYILQSPAAICKSFVIFRFEYKDLRFIKKLLFLKKSLILVRVQFYKHPL